ncbi:uncharacterized protein LOC122513619 isoform X1 [Polistes fuscatus]|uniref:uncharacterized protein LOC122513619 isoform X1 n=1 Tax=Polistes fuscatus TaxID=30207 RepID=UPI001CA96084|nr:uncharacterized protein LOC122513619 isoform X1 [Polistes fuscatus]XP_043485984.1 uncharacterized protein LOC122513619 isoform X1 [Polistes fuscatus]
MGNEDSLDEVNEIACYQNQALKMMQVYESEEKEAFYMWLNKFESVANIISVPTNKMVKFFIKMVDNNFHEHMKKISRNVNFSKLSYDEIIKHYLRFFPPADETYLHRKRFFCRDQYEEETINNYAYCLQKIHKNCYYKCYVDERLCDQFTNGILDNDTKKYLNKIPFLSFDETVTKAIEFKQMNDYLRTALLMMNTYNPKTEGHFYMWLNKFEYVADMIEVPDDKIIAFFNKMVDNTVHESVLKARPSVDVLKLSYDEIISHYINFFFQTREVLLHRKRFKCRNQYVGEPLQKYANNLRKIYKKCAFTYQFQLKICQQFIVGLLDDDIRTHLSKISTKSFETIVEMAIDETEIKKKKLGN